MYPWLEKEVGQGGARDPEVGRGGAHDLEIGRGRARDLEVGRVQGLPQRSEVPVGDQIVVLACYCVSGPAQVCVVVAPPIGLSFVWKRVHWGPRVYEPDRSP